MRTFERKRERPKGPKTLAEAVRESCKAAGHDPDQLLAGWSGVPWYEAPDDYRDSGGNLFGHDGRRKSWAYGNGVEFPVVTIEEALGHQNPNSRSDMAELRRERCFGGRFRAYENAVFATLAADTDETAYSETAAFVADPTGTLVLFGDYGTGKTHLAACACNALIDGGSPCRMISLSDVEREGFDAFPRYMEALSGNRVVVIDDLGAQRDSEYSAQVAFDTVDWLLGQRVGLIVTTNLSKAQLASPNERTRRVIDRIKQDSALVEVKGPNRRNGRPL